jgi:hypothetical protein
MRRRDCCTLLRKSVDLKSGFATVKTSKTGEYVPIPIFPLFREVLEKALAQPSPRPPHYVFPSLEAHYRVNSDHLTDRVRRVMRAAGFYDPEDAKTDEEKGLTVGRSTKPGKRVCARRRCGISRDLAQACPDRRRAHGGRQESDRPPHRGDVTKHYFQPGREEFRRTLAAKLPALPELSGKSL